MKKGDLAMKEKILSVFVMAIMLLNTSCCWSQKTDPQAQKKEIISNLYTRVFDDFQEMSKNVKSNELRDFWFDQACCVRQRSKCNPDDVASLFDYLRLYHYNYFAHVLIYTEEYQIYKNMYLTE